MLAIIDDALWEDGKEITDVVSGGETGVTTSSFLDSDSDDLNKTENGDFIETQRKSYQVKDKSYFEYVGSDALTETNTEQSSWNSDIDYDNVSEFSHLCTDSQDEEIHVQ